MFLQKGLGFVMANIDIGDPKLMRETLCLAQAALMIDIATSGQDFLAGYARLEAHSKRIQQMIDQIDVIRPLGPDGEHGNRHTPYCGCELVAHIGLTLSGRMRPCRCYKGIDHDYQVEN